MTRIALKTIQKSVDLSSIAPTYQLEGNIKSQAEMLEIAWPCGGKRFVILHESRGQPFGTLVDKTEPWKFVLSREAEAEVYVMRRRKEGHVHQLGSPMASHYIPSKLLS